MQVRASPRFWSGGVVSLNFSSGSWRYGLRRCAGRRGRRRATRGRTTRGRCTDGSGAARRFTRFGQLHGPGPLFAGIDFEEAGAVIAARQAILGAADREFLVARAHESLSRPFAATVIVDRIDVIKSC